MMKAKGQKVHDSPPLPQFMTDYIVVGPVSTTLQGATGQLKLVVMVDANQKGGCENMLYS